MSSSMIHGVGRDAARLAAVIASRVASEVRGLPAETTTTGISARRLAAAAPSPPNPL